MQEQVFGSFDEVDHKDNFEPIPGDTYDFRILTPEVEATKNNDGQMVKIPLQIEGGNYEGRKIFARFNVINKNRNAIEIALKQLKQIFYSAGLEPTGDITMTAIRNLEDRMCRAVVYIKKDKEYGDRNEIRKFVVPEMQTAPAMQPQMQQTQAMQPQDGRTFNANQQEQYQNQNNAQPIQQQQYQHQNNTNQAWNNR